MIEDQAEPVPSAPAQLFLEVASQELGTDAPP